MSRGGLTADPQPLEGRFGLMDALRSGDLRYFQADGGSGQTAAAAGFRASPSSPIPTAGHITRCSRRCWSRKVSMVSGQRMVHVYVDLRWTSPPTATAFPRRIRGPIQPSYGIAAALVDGELTLEQYTDQSLHSADYAAMMDGSWMYRQRDPRNRTWRSSWVDGSRLESGSATQGHPLHAP